MGSDIISNDERIALKEAPNLVIKRDKGGNVVIFEKQNYKKEILKQLRDQSIYIKHISIPG